MAKILLVDDDVSITEAIQDALDENGLIVDAAHSCLEGESFLEASEYDLLILDWMMPSKTGIQWLPELRNKGLTLPVLMLTGKDSIDEKAAGLDVGADDYLTKPFHIKELQARVRALLRRPKGLESSEVRSGDLVLDTRSRKIFRGETEIKLTKQEFLLLEFLMKNRGGVFSADALVERAWSSLSESSPDTVRVHMTRLRKKLDIDGAPCPIKTVHRQGYVLE